MAGNDWINSYLEAILDVDTGINDQKSSLLLRERGRFSPAQYFVEEVITGFNETDLHRSWVRVRTLAPIFFRISFSFEFIHGAANDDFNNSVSFCLIDDNANLSYLDLSRAASDQLLFVRSGMHLIWSSFFHI